MEKVSLASQIAAIDQFIQRNCTIYTGAKGDLHREHMRAAAVGSPSNTNTGAGE